jgi:hypothetical protein
MEGMEDEDYELQAALQASLMGDVSQDTPPPVVRHSVPLPSSGSESPSSSSPYATPLDSILQDTPSDLDPVAATMERNRLLLERMKAEQEYAQRQLWADEENQGVRERDTEEEMIRRAIEESEASTRLEGHGTTSDSSPTETRVQDVEQSQTSHYRQDRVYDDDDAELRKILYRYYSAIVSNFFVRGSTEGFTRATARRMDIARPSLPPGNHSSPGYVCIPGFGFRRTGCAIASGERERRRASPTEACQVWVVNARDR